MAKNENPTSATAKPGTFTDRANSAFTQFGDQASSSIESNPLIALAGGIAIGALIAAVLPQTERESGLLQPVGSKVTDAGRASIDKVREAGKAKVDELAGDKLREFFSFNGSSSSAS